MTVEELGERMSGAEFVEWMAWYSLKAKKEKPGASTASDEELGD